MSKPKIVLKNDGVYIEKQINEHTFEVIPIITKEVFVEPYILQEFYFTSTEDAESVKHRKVVTGQTSEKKARVYLNWLIEALEKENLKRY